MKKAGAPGFRHGRVYFAELIPWIGQRGIEDADIDWSNRLKRAQAKREELRLSKDQRSVIDRAEVEEKSQRAISVMLSELDRRFCSELPAIVKGLNELEIRAKHEEAIEELKRALREKFAQLATKEEETQHVAEA